MGTCVEKIAHTCGSKRGLQVFQEEDGSYTGFCFSCGTYEPNPYGESGSSPPVKKLRIKTPEEVQAELQEIQEYPILAREERAISLKVMQHYGVRTSMSEYQANTPVACWYPYYVGDKLSAFKCKTFDKIMFSKGDMRNADMFGWHKVYGANKYKLFITEGEDDAMALFRVLVKNWKYDSYPAVVSLKSGSKSAGSCISKHLQDIGRMFKEVVLCFDNDAPGRAAVSAAAKVLPGVKVATLPLKDANDMLMAGREKELFQAVMYEAAPKVSGSTYNSGEIWHLADEVVEQGLDWPWPSMTEVTRGARFGEVSYFGAGVKMGKSVLVDEIAAHFITKYDIAPFLVKPEEPMSGTLRRLAGKAVGKVFWDPKIPYTKEEFQEGKDLIGNRAYIYDCYQGTDWEQVKREIRVYSSFESKGLVILDPLTCFTVGMSMGEQNEKLVSIASEFAALAKELNFVGVIFCHLNRPDSGLPHERGGKVLSVQFAGSRAMMRQRRM